jgi:hypothetical protein
LYRPAVSPDGRVLAFQGTDHAIHFLDMTSGKDLRRVGVWESEAVAFSPDGRTVAITGTVPSQPPVRSDDVVLQEVDSGRVIRSFGRQRVPFAALAYSPDGHTLVTGSLDGTVRLWEAATGKERRRLEGHLGAITSLSFSADGWRLASTALDRTTLIWSPLGVEDVAEAGREVSVKELEKLWQALATGSGERAYEAVRRLVAAPEQSLPYLHQRLAVTAPEAGRLGRLIDGLNSDVFDLREQAERDLERMGLPAEPALRRALAARPSPETRRRIERLLEKLDGQAVLPVVRAVEVIELIGSDGARRLLRELAKGLAEARQTQEAKAALARLARQTTR